jgi:polysaccharide export outer membrane protein
MCFSSHAPSRLRARIAALMVLGLAVACGHGRDFVWVGSVPKGMAAAEDTYRIGPGDLIGIQVFNQPANSIDRIRVRDDGRISVPFLNDVDVAGAEPAELARRLEAKLRTFITAPVVTVVVHERRPLRVSVLGRVSRPGVYDLERGAGVLHAIAAAGGLTPFADDDGIYVLRKGYRSDGDPTPVRIRFRYGELTAGKAPAAAFVVRAGDVVVVE